MTEVFDVYEANFYNSLRSAQKSLKHPNPSVLGIGLLYNQRWHRLHNLSNKLLNKYATTIIQVEQDVNLIQHKPVEANEIKSKEIKL